LHVLVAGVGCGVWMLYLGELQTQQALRPVFAWLSQHNVNVPALALVAAFLQVWIPRVAALLWLSIQKKAKYDVNHPRGQSAFSGFGLRAQSAHENGIEAMVLFAPAVLLGILLHVSSEKLHLFSIMFVLLRLLFIACYLLNWASLRSAVWLTALLFNWKLYMLCLFR